MKNDRKRKALVGILTVSMVLLGAASASVFAAQNTDTSKDTATSTVSKSKDETVYVLTDAGGKEQQRIVSEGGTLHYNGYEKAQLPVTMEITYTLDGKKITPEKLAGKSGHLVMNLKYTNHEKSGNVCVPFLAASTILLDDEIFSNVEVENGKILQDGNKSMVLGYALPGMQESLGTAEITVPENVIVSADVKKFEIETIYTFITSEVFSEMNLDKNSDLTDLSKNLDKLTGGIDELTAGTGQLADGSEALQSAAGKLMKGTESLNSGIGELYAGTKKLKDGTAGLTEGATELQQGANDLYAGSSKLSEGTAELSAGLSQLSANSESVKAGAWQMVEAVFASANNSLKAAGFPAEVTTENYSQVLEQAAAAYPAFAEQVLTVKGQLDGVIQFYNGVIEYTEGVDSASEGAAQISENMGSFEMGAKQLADGAAKLKDGQSQLSDGIDSLNTGAEKLYDGAGTLCDKETEFVKGARELAEGAQTLNSGVKEMAAEVSSQLSKLSEEDLAGVFDRMNQMEKAAKGYNSFGDDKSFESVKFIFKADAVTTEK